MIPGNANPLLLASAAEVAAAGVATKSLRFNNDDSAHLTRTPSSGGNQKTWTWSGWVKRSSVSGSGTYPDLFGSFFGNSSRYTSLRFDPNDKLFFFGGAGSPATNVINLQTSQVFRDFSAWYHIVLAFDTTQSTASNRAKLYVNGAQITDFDTETYPAQNVDYFINQVNVEHVIGSFFGTGDYLDGYLADVYFIDGLALAPTSFGAYDDNGVWQAAIYSGTYGTNGFHLAFGNSTSNAALGTDSSGNSNTFTVHNINGDAVGLSTANQGFGVVTYTGNGSTQSVTGVGFQPDLVWFKSRSETQNHAVFDVVRGVQTRLHPNLTQSEDSSATGLTAFNSDGFTVGSNNVNNKSGTTYVAWCWKAGGSASSNTDGTITSSVSANTTYGFSIVGYTGNNTAGATVGHGLSSTPKWIIVKSRDQDGQFWHVYHASLDADEYAYLNNSNAVTSGNDFMNGTRPTSSVFTLGNGNGCNKSGDDVIAYCWAEVSGFSKISSYNGSGGDATKVVTGFRPRYIIARPINDSNGNRWHIVDTERGVGGSAERLFAEDSTTHTARQEVLIENDGFIVTNTTTDSGSLNRNTEYIYAAFASKPSGEEVDSLFDVPTNGTQSDTGAGGEVSGNYATLNVLNRHSTSNDTLSNGNLECSMGSGSAGLTPSTIGFSSGKFYYEVVFSGSVAFLAGIRRSDSRNYDNSYTYHANGNKYTNGGSATSYGATYTDGDVIGVAVDMDAGTLTFYKNGASQGQAFSGISGTYTFIQGKYSGSGGSYIANFGQRAFAYSAPSGFKALCTTNLPTATVPDGSDYHDTVLYTGNGASSRTISGYSFSPDFLWVKVRTATGGDFSPRIMDAVRGAGVSLRTNGTDAERDSSATTGGGVETFTSDGFTIEAGGGSNINANNNNSPYVAWAWDAGSSTASNTSGNITSSVRANQTAGFSIVGFNLSVTNTEKSVGHGLNAAPTFYLVKNRSSSDNWYAYTTAVDGTLDFKYLNTTDAFGASSRTLPTSSVFYFASSTTGDHIAYCFTPVAGFSAFGSYTGNASNDGPFVYTGFRVKWLMVKGSSYASNWNIVDATRNEFNETDLILRANLSNAEVDGSAQGNFAMGFDFLSNGFKVRRSGVDVNSNGNTLIWAAFAENPFQANGGLAR